MHVDVLPIITANRIRYLEEIGVLPQELFQNTITGLKDIFKDHIKELDSVDVLRESLVMAIQKYVEEKTQENINLARKEGNVELEKEISSITITVIDTIEQKPQARKLPRVNFVRKIADHLLYQDPSEKNFGLEKGFRGQEEERKAQEYFAKRYKINQNFRGINPNWKRADKFRHLYKINLMKESQRHLLAKKNKSVHQIFVKNVHN